MKHRPDRTPHLRHRRTRGITLIELLLSIVIGLLITSAAVAAFSGISALSRNVRGAAGVAQNAIITNGYFMRQIQRAGYLDLMGDDNRWAMLNTLDGVGAPITRGDGSLLSLAYQSSHPNLYALHGCNGAYKNPATLLDYECAASTTQTAASISAAYQIMVPATSLWSAPSLGGSFSERQAFMTDCGGRATRSTDNTKANPPGDVVLNRYYLRTSDRSLRCIGNGDPTVSVEIASNVEQFHVLYGLPQAADATTPGEAVAKLVPASSVAAAAGGWSSVISMQLCLLIASEPGPNASGSTATNIYNLDCVGQPVSTSDGRVRRAHRISYGLRNNLRSATALP